jgi:hypothetical protein
VSISSASARYLNWPKNTVGQASTEVRYSPYQKHVGDRQCSLSHKLAVIDTDLLTLLRTFQFLSPPLLQSFLGHLDDFVPVPPTHMLRGIASLTGLTGWHADSV